MEEFICRIIIVALLAAFTLTIAHKWGLVEYMQINGNDFINKLANCQFCLSFWTCCFVVMLISIITFDVTYLIIPFFSTPITKKML